MAKNFVVTGGTNGIGKSIVDQILRNAKENDKIIVNYGHNEINAKNMYDMLTPENRNKIELLKADLSSYDELEKFVSEIKNRISNIDFLICNIGIGEYARFDDYTIEMWDKVMTTNLTIPTFLIKELKDYMNAGGSILLMGSYAGQKGYSSSVVYSISKAGVLFLPKVLLKELEPLQIRINALAPGFVETSWQNGRSSESRDRINRKIALHRFGSPEEIAEMAYAVLTNSYMNGEVISIHGGYEYF